MLCKASHKKGALVSRELSLTLATGNDQTVITHPDVECLDMRQEEVHDKGIAPTLIATDYKGGKAVSFYPYLQKECPMDECSNTLINGDCPGHQNAVAFTKDGHPQTADGGQTYREAEVAKTLNCFATGESRAEELVCEDGACPTLDANYPGKMNNQDVGKLVCCEQHPQDVRCFENHGNDSRVTESEGISPTITSRSGTGGNNLPLVMTADEPIGFIKNDAGGEEQGFWKEVFPTVRSQVIPAVAYNVSFCDANGTRKDRPDGGLYVTEAETSKTVTTGGTNAETVIVNPVALDGDKMAKAERKGGSGLGISTDGVMYTQTVKDVHAVAYEEPIGIDQYNGAVTGDASATLGVNCGDTTGRNGVLESGECVPLDLRNATRDPEKHDEMNRQGVGVGADGEPMNTVTAGAVPGVGWQAAVRRLLPVECERLMGFPDGHTLIKWKGKPESECPDAPRYKACGNSMCVNVRAWIGQRIDAVEKIITSREAIKSASDNENGEINE